MTSTSYGLMLAAGLFVGMVVVLETGRRIAIRRLTRDPEGARQGLGVAEGAVFSLLGLLIAFTFSRGGNALRQPAASDRRGSEPYPYRLAAH